MEHLVFDPYDRFNVMYDLLSLVNENVTTESAIVSAMQISPGIVQELVSFTLFQGFVKADRSDKKFRITTLGCDFLRQFRGMRKFLS